MRIDAQARQKQEFAQSAQLRPIYNTSQGRRPFSLTTPRREESGCHQLFSRPPAKLVILLSDRTSAPLGPAAARSSTTLRVYDCLTPITRRSFSAKPSLDAHLFANCAFIIVN